MIKAVIFDMDGLMFDTEAVTFQAYKKIAPRFGITDIHALYHSTLGTSDEETARIMGAALHSMERAAAFTEQAAAQAAAYYKEHSTPEMPGLRELLFYIKSRGLKCGVASGSSKENVTFHLHNAALLPEFDAVVNADMVQHCKPHPEPFLECARLLNVPPVQCVVLEDSVNGIRAAHAANMHAVMVPNLQQPDPYTETLLAYKAQDLHAVKNWLTAQE